MSSTEPQVAEDPGAWTARVGELISYRYLGTHAESRGRHEAEGWITIRRDLRGAVGLRAAPLGIALLGTAGINVDPLAVVAPTRIDVHLFEPAADVAEVHLAGRVLPRGTLAVLHRGPADRRRRPVAGHRCRIDALGGVRPEPGVPVRRPAPGAPDSPDLPPLHEPFGARRRDDGRFEIPELGPELGAEGLHQGPFQVVSEAAAMQAATEAVGSDRFWIEHQGTSIMARGVGVPLVTTTDVMTRAGGAVIVRVELRAEGADDRLCSVSLCRFRLA